MLKKLERGWKAICFSILFTFLRLERSRHLPDWRTGKHSILLLRPDGIGDALVTTPLLLALARLSSGLHIDVVASPANAPILREMNFVRNVFIFDKRRRGSLLRLARQLTRQRYDAVIDPRVIAPSMTGLILMLATGAPHRLGVGERGADRGLTFVAPYRRGHIVDLLAGFAPAFGIERAELTDRLYVPLNDADREWGEAEWTRWGGSADGPRLLVNVSAGEAPRTWPDDYFVSTLRALRSELPELNALVIAAPTEAARGEGIAAAAAVPFVPTATLGRVSGLVAAADHVFTPDTSVVHVAAAFGKPTVAMYLRQTAWQWGAHGVPGANIEAMGSHLAELDPAPVLTELRKLLRRAPEDRLGAKSEADA